MASSNNSNENEKVIVPGVYLEAWEICFSDFVNIEDLSTEEKKLEHYDVQFAEDNINYIITFVPKLLSEAEAKKTKLMVIGRETRYWVDKTKLRVIKRLFYKA